MRSLFTTTSSIMLLSIVLTACSGSLPMSVPTIPVINTATETPSPIPSTTPTLDPSFTNTPAVMSGWGSYTDPIYGFSFQYPPSNQTCCSISGPMTGKVQHIITLADEATTVPNTDAPFDGFAVYVTYSYTLTLPEYVELEKTAQTQASEIALGKFTPSGSDTTVTIGGQSGIAIQGYCWDGIQRIYIPFPDRNQILVIAVLEKSKGSFEQTMTQILSSFHFAGYQNQLPDEIVGEFDIKRALEIMYKGWTITTTDSGKIYAQQEDIGKGVTLKVYVNLVMPFRQQQDDKYLVVTTYSDSQAIRAYHSIRGTVFVQQKGKWVLEHTGMLASYSGSATSELVQIGMEHFGVLVHTQYAGTGRGVVGAVLNAYTSAGWQKVWEARIGEAEFERWNYSSDIVFLADEKGEYYNMQVTTTGTDSSLKRFDETKLYSFDEGVYKLVSTIRHEFP